MYDNQAQYFTDNYYNNTMVSLRKHGWIKEKYKQLKLEMITNVGSNNGQSCTAQGCDPGQYDMSLYPSMLVDRLIQHHLASYASPPDVGRDVSADRPARLNPLGQLELEQRGENAPRQDTGAPLPGGGDHQDREEETGQAGPAEHALHREERLHEGGEQHDRVGQGEVHEVQENYIMKDIYISHYDVNVKILNWIMR